MRFLVGGAAAIALLAAGGSAAAAPVQWTIASGGNGHYYDVVTTSEGNISWTEALEDAALRTFNDQQGYLATITSSGENAFLASVSSVLGWIAGSDVGAEGAFTWWAGPESGAALTYASWNAGEPNDNLGEEDYIQFNWRFLGAWNDAPGGRTGDTATPHYFIEYGGLDSGVPEPAAWALMILGFGGAGVMLRRMRNATFV